MKRKSFYLYVLIHILLFVGIGLIYVAYNTYITTEDFFTLTLKVDAIEDDTYYANPLVDMVLLLLFGSLFIFVGYFILGEHYVDGYHTLKKKIKKRLKL